jgi:hypothetical protein
VLITGGPTSARHGPGAKFVTVPVLVKSSPPLPALFTNDAIRDFCRTFSPCRKTFFSSPSLVRSVRSTTAQ